MSTFQHLQKFVLFYNYHTSDFENLVLRQDTLMAAMVDTNIVEFRSFSEINNWFSEIVFQFDFVCKRGRKLYRKKILCKLRMFENIRNNRVWN